MAWIEGPDGKTRLFPIFGDPIVYVRSPEFLTRGFRARGHNAMCVAMEVSEAGLDTFMKGISAVANVDGLLVTMPHKSTAFAYCSTASETSRRLKVVSVIRRNKDGSWHGDMLDGDAFVKAQVDNGARPAGAKVLLLGAGGAGSAIAISLLRAGVRELVIHDADTARVQRLLAISGDLAQERAHAGLADPTGCDMVCNATPMGMSPDDPPPLDLKLLKASMFVGDIIAGHGETVLVKAAREAGCKTATGDHMVEAVQTVMLDFMLNV